MNFLNCENIKRMIFKRVKKKVSKKIIYLVSHSIGGGLSQYIRNIAEYYANDNTIDIYTNENLSGNNIKYLQTDELIYLLHNDNRKNVIIHININPYISLLFDYFINMILSKNRAKIIITIHDMYWIYPNNPIIEFSKISTKISEQQLDLVQQLFNKTDKLIFPSNFIFNIYNKYFTFERNNMHIEEHPDLKIPRIELWPKITNGIIKILYLGNATIIKGICSVISYLSDIKHIQYQIELHVLGAIGIDIENIDCDLKITYYNRYSCDNVFEKIKDIQPNIILMSSMVSETWSYTASIILKTGLPIFFNDICVYRERIEKYKRTNIASYCTHTDSPKNISIKLIKFIEFLEQNQKNDKFCGSDYVIEYSDFYKSLYF